VKFFRDISLFHKKRRSKGATFIIVMGITLCLITMALYFCDSMVLEYRAAENNIEGMQASQAIEGARRYMGFILENADNPGFVPDPETYVSEKVPVGSGFFWIIGRDEDTEENANIPGFGIVSEASKLNLNTATRDMLEALPQMTTELAAAIIDWRDTDMDPSSGGAESEYYLLLDDPYQCKNGPFESIEELRLVMGGDWEVLYGEDLNRNGILDPNENDGEESPPSDNADGVLDFGILEYVTVFSREPNKQEDGSGRINITTQRQELEALLRENFGQERANQIQAQTQANLRNIRSVLEYYLRSQMTLAEFSRIKDALTITDDETINGLVNVNTAPAEVLSCIPGLDQETSEKIVSARKEKTADDLESIAWIAEILENDQCIEAGPHLTTRSYQFCADIAALGLHGRGYKRELMIFDTSGEKAVVLFRRDLARFGFALGSSVKEDFLKLAEE